MREIRFGKPILTQNEKEAVNEVISGDILVHGPKSKEFENLFCEFTNAPFAITLSSCTAALHLSYLYFGIGPGDEVIVPSMTHVATAHAVEYNGATPVFVDSEMVTGNIDIEQIEESITENTKAISIVHYLGMPVNMNRILGIANKHCLKIIEDCALAVGSMIGGKHVGLFGNIGCFSFYPVKHITTAEGGMLITQEKEIAERIKRTRAFGYDRTVTERKVSGDYDVNLLGFNYRMNEIQAAIGVEQIKKVKSFLKKRKENYEYLEKRLKDINEIHLFHSTHGDYQSSYYCLTIVLDDTIAVNRHKLVDFLNENGIGTSIYYPKPIPNFSYYKEKYNINEDKFPNARKISSSSIALPVGPHLEIDDMEYIAERLKAAIAKVLT